MHHGSCLCGAVRLTVEAPLQDPIACHCQQCRRQSGHYFSAVAAPKSALTLDGADALTWYRASPVASRGFCGTCGATLFWRADDSPWIMVAMAALDAPTGMHLSAHYWVDHKGDYYTIADDLPQHEGETA